MRDEYFEKWLVIENILGCRGTADVDPFGPKGGDDMVSQRDANISERDHFSIISRRDEAISQRDGKQQDCNK